MMNELIGEILCHPFSFIAGLLLVVAGPWLLRMAGTLLLSVLAIGIGLCVNEHLISAGLYGAGSWQTFMVLAAMVLLALLLRRHPVVVREAQVLFIAILCFMYITDLAAWLAWPKAVVLACLLGGMAVAQPVALATLAAAFVAMAAGINSPWISVAIFGVCLMCLDTTLYRRLGLQQLIMQT